MGLQLYLHDRCRPVRDHALIIEHLRKKNAVSLRADHSPAGMLGAHNTGSNKFSMIMASGSRG